MSHNFRANPGAPQPCPGVPQFHVDLDCAVLLCQVCGWQLDVDGIEWDQIPPMARSEAKPGRHQLQVPF